MYSSIWQLEVSIAGAGFAINGQFINRTDNWENRAEGVQHSMAIIAECAPAQCTGVALLKRLVHECNRSTARYFNITVQISF